MAELKDSGTNCGISGRVVVDGHYLKQQAGEAFRTFIAPLAGVYGAAVGSNRVIDHPHRDGLGKRA